MMVDDIILGIARDPYNLPHASWLAGAAAGLQILKPRTPKYEWEGFISDVYDMMSQIENIVPAPPGTAPDYGDGELGSAYDSLGGYVSVVGEVCPEGLFFRVPIARQEQVLELLKDLTLFRYHGEILVPTYSLPAFTRLCPLEGPVAEEVEMEVLL